MFRAWETLSHDYLKVLSIAYVGTEMAAILESKMAAIAGSFLRILDFATDWNLINVWGHNKHFPH